MVVHKSSSSSSLSSKCTRNWGFIQNVSATKNHQVVVVVVVVIVAVAVVVVVVVAVVVVAVVDTVFVIVTVVDIVIVFGTFVAVVIVSLLYCCRLCFHLHLQDIRDTQKMAHICSACIWHTYITFFTHVPRVTFVFDATSSGSIGHPSSFVLHQIPARDSFRTVSS